MNLDLYSKTVLTVIAIALVGILGQNSFKPAVAQANNSCGGPRQPCLVVPALYESYSNTWKPCYDTDKTCFIVGARAFAR